MGRRCNDIGKLFEHLICDCIEEKGIQILGKQRNKPLQSFSDTKIKKEKINKVLDYFSFQPHTWYQLTPLSQGVQGDTSDIVMIPSNIRLSIKHNNMFIKHQRCNKLHKQLKLGHDDARQFEEEYKAINDKYFNKWKHCKTFNRCDKTELYNEINRLSLKWMSGKHEHLVCYLNFILDLNPKKYIIFWDKRKQLVQIIHFDKLKDIIYNETPHLYISGNFIIIDFSSILIKMRLHNASSRITRTLSLKYCTTIQDNGAIFTYINI